MAFLGNEKKSFAAILLVCSMLLAFVLLSDVNAAVQDIEGHWAEESIQNWLDQELATGYPDGTFRPDGEVTRAEFVAFVNRAFDISEAAEPPGFEDVQEEDWFYEHVAAAVDEGILTGYPDNTFLPDNPITREESTVIVNRLLELEETQPDTPFVDEGEISDWAEEAVTAVSAAEIITGYPDDTFRPGDPITRAETISILDRALEHKEPVGEKHTVTFVEINSLERIEIEVFDEQGETAAELETDANGEAKENFENGTYEFTASQRNYPDYHGTFTIEGEPETVEFGVEHGTISGEVTILDQEGNPDPDSEPTIPISAYSEEDQFNSQTKIEPSTGDGKHIYEYTLENVAPATYTVGTSSDGYMPDDVQDVDVEAGENVENIDLVLKGGFKAEPSWTWQGKPLKVDFSDFAGKDGDYDIEVEVDDQVIGQTFTIEDVTFENGKATDVVILEAHETTIEAHHPVIYFNIEGTEAYNEFVIAQQISENSHIVEGSGTYDEDDEQIIFEVEAFDLVGDKITRSNLELDQLFIENNNVTDRASLEWNDADDVWEITVTDQQIEPSDGDRFELSLEYTPTDKVVELEALSWQEIKEPQPYFSANIYAPDEAGEGEEFEVTFEIENTGNEAGEQEVTGEAWKGTFQEFTETWIVKLESGESQSQTYLVEPTAPYYDYSITLETENDKDTHTVEIE